MNVKEITYSNSIRKKQNFSKGFFVFYSLILVFYFFSIFQIHAYVQYGTQRKTLEEVKNLSDTVHIALYDQDITINFYEGFSNIESQIQSALFSGLVSLDTYTLDIQNNLAASVFINDDLTKYTFHIKEDALFSDGTVITARDVRESWLAILHSDSVFSYLLEPIVGVLQYQEGEGSLDDIGIDIVSDKTVRVRLERPNSEFLKIITHSVFSITKANFSKLDNWESIINIVPYSGPYIISEKTDDYILLQKNQSFWAKDIVKSKYIVLHMYASDEEDKLVEDILYNNIHWSTFGVDSKEIDDSWLYVNAIFGTEYLFFHTKKEPWNNADVRTAIRLLVPFDKIRSDNYSFPTATLIPHLLGTYTSPEIDSDQNIEKALTLLEEAGYPNGNGLPPLVILAPSFNNEYNKIFDIIKFHIEKLSNIVVTIQARPNDKYFSSLNTDDFVIGYNGWIGDYASPFAFLQMWLSSNEKLGHHYDNEAYKESYMKAMSLSEYDEDKISSLQKTELILLDTTVVIPLSYLYAVNIVRNDILEGWEKNILDQHQFALLSQIKPIPIPFVTQKIGKINTFSLMNNIRLK